MLGYRYWKHYHGKIPTFDPSVYSSDSNDQLATSARYEQSAAPTLEYSMNHIEPEIGSSVQNNYPLELNSEHSVRKLMKHLQNDLDIANQNMRALEDHLKDF